MVKICFCCLRLCNITEYDVEELRGGGLFDKEHLLNESSRLDVTDFGISIDLATSTILLSGVNPNLDDLISTSGILEEGNGFSMLLAEAVCVEAFCFIFNFDFLFSLLISVNLDSFVCKPISLAV